jgi:hypothetical protein
VHSDTRPRRPVRASSPGSDWRGVRAIRGWTRTAASTSRSVGVARGRGGPHHSGARQGDLAASSSWWSTTRRVPDHLLPSGHDRGAGSETVARGSGSATSASRDSACRPTSTHLEPQRGVDLHDLHDPLARIVDV